MITPKDRILEAKEIAQGTLDVFDDALESENNSEMLYSLFTVCDELEYTLKMVGHIIYGLLPVNQRGEL